MYSFKITYGATTKVCYPKYKDTLLFEEEKREDSTIGDKTLKTSLTFNSTDYDNIIAQPFGTRFTVDIYSNTSIYFTGYFFIQDCKISKKGVETDKTLIVNLKSDNLYNKLQEILSAKCKLNELDLKKTAFYYKKQPLLQYYVTNQLYGDTIVTNFINGYTFEQDCTPLTAFEISYSANPLQDGGDLQEQPDWSYPHSCDTYAVFKTYLYIGTGLNTTRSGRTNTFIRSDGKYQCDYVFRGLDGFRWELKNLDTNTIEWISNDEAKGSGDFNDITEVTFTEVIGGATAQFSDSKWVYSRCIGGVGYNADMFPNGATSKTVLDNYFTTNEQYTYTINNEQDVFFGILHEATGKKETQITENEYVKSSNGKYFIPPISETNYKYFPIGQNMWESYSIWIRSTDEMGAFQTSESVDMKSNGYFVSDIIKSILSKYSIPLNQYSLFFNDTTNPISGISRKYPLLTDIQNLNGVQPWANKQATNTVISLNDIFQLYKDLFNVVYEVQGNTLRIEHQFFFENGGSYGSAPIVGLDLTTKSVTRFETYTWADFEDEYEYQLPEIYKYINMSSNGSDFFNNSKISNNIDYSEATNEIDLTNFCMDIDYITVQNADNLSGFAFFMCNFDTTVTVPYQVNGIEIKGSTYFLQNYYASLPFNAREYKIFGFHNTTVTVDGDSVTVKGFFRGKLQEVTYPLGIFGIDIKKLVKTNLGIAFIRKNSIYLEDNYCKIELLHEV